jgi:hypothetical protein
MKTERANEASVAVNAGEAASDSNVSKEKHEQMWTMDDAFGWNGYGSLETDGLDLERGIRSVAFLLEYLSAGGNEELDGFVAYGLGECLSFCAKKSARLQRRHNRGDGL